MERINVVLYSAGLDSLLLLHKVKPEKALFVRTGTLDNLYEEKLVDSLFASGSPLVANTLLIKVDMACMANWELPNKTLPFRNQMLAIVAAQYGNDLWFGFTQDDVNRDTDTIFRSLTEANLNYFANSGRVKIQGPFTVNMPFKFQSKTQMVKEYLENGGKSLYLTQYTRSCYGGTSILECGECISCIRKYVAFTKNGLEVTFATAALPNLSRYLDSLPENSIERGDIQDVLNGSTLIVNT